MIDAVILRRTIDRALAGGGDYADVFVERRRSRSVVMEDSRVERVNAGLEQGAGVRVCSGLATAYAYTDDLSAGGLLRAAGAAAAAVRAQGAESLSLLDLVERGVPRQGVIRPPGDIGTDVAIELLQRADDAARSVGGEIRQVTAQYSDSVQSIVIATSDGILARDSRTRVRAMVQAVAVRGNEVQSALETPGAGRGFEAFAGDVLERAAATAAHRARLLLDADAAPSGTMPVVVGNQFGGVLFHEASGHGLEADHIARRASVFAGQVGSLVASPLVTAVDDGTIAGAWGTLGVDDEGSPVQRTVLIEEGVLTGYMFDHLRARQEGRPSTGNGRRQSYQHIPMPRMTNTFILAGESTPEEVLAATPRGLYAKALGAGQVNPVTGDFVFAVTEGYLIEAGRVTRPVRGATLVGNGPQALRRIDMVAADLGLAPGTCGKDGQSVPVSVGQPTLRIAELVVGGTQPAGGVQM